MVRFTQWQILEVAGSSLKSEENKLFGKCLFSEKNVHFSEKFKTFFFHLQKHFKYRNPFALNPLLVLNRFQSK